MKYKIKQLSLTERQLQKSIATLLKIKGIVTIYSRMDRPTTNNVGTPDFIFSVHTRRNGFEYDEAVAWEVKLPNKKQSPNQVTMQERMERAPNAWRYRVITSLQQAIKELAESGI
jgi:hypothetical protein